MHVASQQPVTVFPSPVVTRHRPLCRESGCRRDSGGSLAQIALLYMWLAAPLRPLHRRCRLSAGGRHHRSCPSPSFFRCLRETRRSPHSIIAPACHHFVAASRQSSHSPLLRGATDPAVGPCAKKLLNYLYLGATTATTCHGAWCFPTMNEMLGEKATPLTIQR